MWIELMGHKINIDRVTNIYKDKVDDENIEKPFQICFDFGGLAMNCAGDTQYDTMVIGFKDVDHRDKVFKLLDDHLEIKPL